MSKELFGEASKCKNKKQEARRKKKIEQEKLEGKSLDIKDGGLEDMLPPAGEGVYRVPKERKIVSASSKQYRVQKKKKDCLS